MRVLITGACGFVGGMLVQRLLKEGVSRAGDVTQLLLVDQNADILPTDRRLTFIAGDFGMAHTLDALLSEPVDIVFHLASVPGALAEADRTLGDRVNLHATLSLFERLAQQVQTYSRVARVVFASSVAVYGAPMPSRIDEHTSPAPTTSYGVHKLIGEQILADWTRRGKLDARSLRLPGIVARPGLSTARGSAFMSAIFDAARHGRPYTCPVSPSATPWWMSRVCCIDNLLQAARLPAAGLATQRVWTPPVLRLTVQAVVDALARQCGTAPIVYAADEAIERQFGRQPPMIDRRAVAAGFLDDGTIDALITRALADA